MIKIYLMRFILRLLYILPIKNNRIVLTSYNGRQYSCSPKYIAESINSKKYQVIYALKKDLKIELPKEINRINYKSIRHFIYLMTAKYIVVNSTGFTCLLPYRKKQVLINTWHGGGAFKKTGISHFNSKKDIKARKIIGNNTTYFISSSKVFGEQQSYSMCIDSNKILNIGTPRNDLLFTKNNLKIYKKVRDTYNIAKEYGIVLYAPTYRDGKVKSLNDYGINIINIEKVLNALEKRFNRKFKFLFRAHHDMIPETFDSNSINASSYGDIQELLYVADVLITDYSSCMWDFALMNKPGFLYTPDLEQYQSVHNFASPIDSWPYCYSNTNEELEKSIFNFDENKNKRKINKYFEEMGSYENGNATKELLKTIFKDDK